MKRLSISLLALALAGFAWGAYAADYKCKSISGNITIAPEAGCTIATTPAYKKRFPSVTFLGLGTCFTGTFDGFWDNRPITGTSISGLTLIATSPPVYSPDFATAATVLKVKDKNNNTLGSLYFLDTIRFRTDGSAEEQLVITEGTGAFLGAKATSSPALLLMAHCVFLTMTTMTTEA